MMSLKLFFKATKCPVRERSLFLAGEGGGVGKGAVVFGCITIKFT